MTMIISHSELLMLTSTAQMRLSANRSILSANMSNGSENTLTPNKS